MKGIIQKNVACEGLTVLMEPQKSLNILAHVGLSRWDYQQHVDALIKKELLLVTFSTHSHTFAWAEPEMVLQ